MTTMRSVEPLLGVDAVLARIFPFLNGTEPEVGEHGTDSHGNRYVRTPEGSWSLIRLHEPEPEAEA
jgi:hypothetical protein